MIKDNTKVYLEKYNKVIITGGCGFIGSALIRRLLLQSNCTIFNLDKFGYASDDISIQNILKKINDLSRYKFINLDLSNFNKTLEVLRKIKPDYIFHFAAESHVDNSISDPSIFLKSNVVGTFNLLEATRSIFEELSNNKKNLFRFQHISTDEVYGSLGEVGFFNETSQYSPNSPYSASKAASDHFVNAWNHTFDLPTITTNCSNNFGPWQYPEKLIPTIILKAISNKKIPIYGDGKNIRDWLYVEDHIDALLQIAENGATGQNYCIGASNEKSNIEICEIICKMLDALKPQKKSYLDLISFVQDRPGHDKRYAIDSSFLRNTIGWIPNNSFEKGIEKTVKWYISNLDWCKIKFMNKKNCNF